MRRAVILTTLTLLLLAVTGITLAGESTIGTARNSPTESTVQDTAAITTGEPTATTVRQATVTTDEESTRGGEPAAGNAMVPTKSEADEPEVTEGEATGAEVKNTGKPEGVGKPKGVGSRHVGNGRATDDEGEARGDGGQEKVTLCHKGKNTIRVGEPAVAAHQRHEDSLGPCQTEQAAPGPPEGTPGAGAAQNGDGGGGNGQEKVTLCHKGKTLTVNAHAQAAHLRHGDTRGPCAG